MSSKEKNVVAASTLSLVSGVLILGFSAYILSWVIALQSTFRSWLWNMGGMIDGPMMGAMWSFFGIFPALGVVFGAIIIVGALMLKKRPEESNMWGLIILIVSALSFISGGGLVIGAILGIVAGILAIVS